MHQQEVEQDKIQLQNKIRTYALLAGLAMFSIIAFILYRNNRQKQKANKILETTLINLKIHPGPTHSIRENGFTRGAYCRHCTRDTKPF
jgi:hypothetical protein